MRKKVILVSLSMLIAAVAQAATPAQTNYQVDVQKQTNYQFEKQVQDGSSTQTQSLPGADGQLIRDVHEAIKNSSELYNVNITVADGVVTLNGFVSSSDAKKDIEEKIKGVKGIKQVVNNLSVQSNNKK